MSAHLRCTPEAACRRPEVPAEAVPVIWFGVSSGLVPLPLLSSGLALEPSPMNAVLTPPQQRGVFLLGAEQQRGRSRKEGSSEVCWGQGIHYGRAECLKGRCRLPSAPPGENGRFWSRDVT